ncbi:F-box protein At5g49610-like [Aegilops tauschii subsp. strangulata]|uniref:F-box protein At5g49610-like n=1 Tax=Aegilops tauschii subsp. strangulata TaxID=200361 RepID=UPI00098AF872
METAPGVVGLCDDVLVEILVRLPSKSVLRCRAVCKRWRRITTDGSFLAAHAAHAASCTREMIIRPGHVYDPSSLLAVETIRLSLDPRPRPIRFLCNRTHLMWCRVLYSLDGLLVLQPQPSRYIICNPMTRQSASLPPLAPQPCFTACACGFYLHGSSNEYRLLCHCLQGEAREHSYYILSTASTLPRRLGRAPTPADLPTSWVRYEVPVAHCGILHWFSLHPEATRTGKMLVFHTVSETFRLMLRPPERPGDATTSWSLFELDGELCIAAMQSETSLDIWVLQDYKAESWMLRHRVTMLGGSNAVTMTMVVSVGSGAILIGSRYCDVARLYNLKDKKTHKDVIFGPSLPTFLLFSESLVSHAFFDSPPHPGFESISFSPRRGGS